ncbi:COX assembly mitochondrial protein 2 [Smittium culicis]|uniref:Sulfhydryl oxidase n=1 Tax=Smittium culicis TaxID=133412 RepID=A0A1R1YHV9_9FUNG|nr:COX assembly mitochondrial protein 2 [Smittium culicis]
MIYPKRVLLATALVTFLLILLFTGTFETPKSAMTEPKGSSKMNADATPSTVVVDAGAGASKDRAAATNNMFPQIDEGSALMGKMVNETLRKQLGNSTWYTLHVGSRDEFEQWLCTFHNAVNTRLGKKTVDCSKVHEMYDCGCGPDLVRIMHPHVAEHKNVSCVEFIRALDECHNSNKWRKFFGFCNEPHDLLNKCLAREYESNRKKQLVVSREKRAQIEQKWKDIEANR